VQLQCWHTSSISSAKSQQYGRYAHAGQHGIADATELEDQLHDSVYDKHMFSVNCSAIVAKRVDELERDNRDLDREKRQYKRDYENTKLLLDEEIDVNTN
jgi:hypothetical protein